MVHIMLKPNAIVQHSSLCVWEPSTQLKFPLQLFSLLKQVTFNTGFIICYYFIYFPCINNSFTNHISSSLDWSQHFKPQMAQSLHVAENPEQFLLFPPPHQHSISSTTIPYLMPLLSDLAFFSSCVPSASFFSHAQPGPWSKANHFGGCFVSF